MIGFMLVLSPNLKRHIGFITSMHPVEPPKDANRRGVGGGGAGIVVVKIKAIGCLCSCTFN